MPMRRMIALSLLLSGLSAPAFAVQDRYGPPRAPDVDPSRAAAAPANRLTWAAKSAEPDYRGDRALATVAPWTERRSSLAGAQPATSALPPPPDGPRALPRPAPLATQTPSTLPVAAAPPQSAYLSAGGPQPLARPTIVAEAQARQFPPPVAPWTERRPTAAAGAAQGEGLTLHDMPTGNSAAKGVSKDDAIPVTQTKQNAAATRNSPIDF